MQGLLPNKSVVGIDFGGGAVKAVEWTRGSIRACALAPVAAEQDSSECSAPEAALRSALRKAAPSAGKAVVGLNAGEVLVHAFRLPQDLPIAEIEEQARLRALKAAPYPASEVCYDYQPEGANDQQVSYRMVIARSTAVRALCATVESAGLKVAAVDLTPFAVQRALAASVLQERAWAVLDGGYGATRLSVYGEGGRLAFQHSQPFGCRDLTLRLQQALGLTPSESHKAIEDCRVPGGPLHAVRSSFLDDLARHAARALQLLDASEHDAAAPERIFFWGGSALLHGACGVLSKALGIPVQLAEHGREMAAGTNAPAYSPAFLGAYALALNDHA